MGGGTGDSFESFGMQDVEKIRKKVKNHQGDIVLCSREIITGTPRGPYDSHDKYESVNFETGIISGNLRSSEGYRQIKTVSLSHLDLKQSVSRDYSFTASHEIPVKNKLVKGIPSFVWPIFNFNFAASDLEKACEGEIVFGYKEFTNASKILEVFGYAKEFPYLKSINFYVGENEIRKYFSQKRGTRKISELDDFIALMKTPGEIEKRVEDYKFKERTAFADNLIISVAELLGLDRRIRGIEKRVLSSTLHIVMEQDGDRFNDWGSNAKSVDEYRSLRTDVFNLTEKVEQQLRKSDEIGLKELSHIGGESLGFPVNVSLSDYLQNIQINILPDVKERLEKLDSHLREQRKKNK